MSSLLTMIRETRRAYKEIDNKNSFTTAELCEGTGLSESTVRRIADKKVKSGLWEQVWKQLDASKKAAMSWRKVAKHKGR